MVKLIYRKDFTAEKWAAKHNLQIITLPCLNCNEPLTANIPFETKFAIGFISETHDCGPEYDLEYLVPKDKADRYETC